MKKSFLEVGIIGGGLAGLTAGICLARKGIRAHLWEKKPYPHHKVCGEYVSNEVLPLLMSLGLDPFSLGAVDIRRFMLSTSSGRSLESKLPLGGFGLSRYTLDQALYELGLEAGLTFHTGEQVDEIDFKGEDFHILTARGGHSVVPVVIGAFGKRSSLDRRLQRPFFKKSSPFIAVKRHYSGFFPEDLVALHNFPGGYCGVSRVEEGRVNICYLTTQTQLKKAGTVEALDHHVFSSNPCLRELGEELSPTWEKPLTISQIWFKPKAPVEKHILMAGDTAGLIYPLCGNGMAMAIHAGKMAAEVAFSFLKGELSRAEMEGVYRREWRKTFQQRLQFGRLFQPFLGNVQATETAIRLLGLFPGALPRLIRQTHGELLKPST
jgi:flavin-dependent dehydrogenase